MGNLRKKSIRAYLLLESLLALALLASLTAVVLDLVKAEREQRQSLQKEIEGIKAGIRAVELGEKNLSLNGVEVRLEEEEEGRTFRLKNQKKELLRLEIQDEGV